jgi:ribosomal protein S18 acetylase RimI-like enzyme
MWHYAVSLQLMIIRRAEEQDLSFLTTAVLEAEKSGTDVLTYTTLFGLEESRAAITIAQMLEEDIEGQELSLSGFLLAEEEGRYAGAVSAWIEGSGGQPSPFLKSGLMYHILGKEKMGMVSRYAEMIEQLHIPRRASCLQIECVYVSPEFRGRGIAARLIRAHIRSCMERQLSFGDVEIQLMLDNKSALSAYSNLGFEITLQKKCVLPGVTEVFPSSSRILMTLPQSNAVIISSEP